MIINTPPSEFELNASSVRHAVRRFLDDVEKRHLVGSLVFVLEGFENGELRLLKKALGKALALKYFDDYQGVPPEPRPPRQVIKDIRGN